MAQIGNSAQAEKFKNAVDLAINLIKRTTTNKEMKFNVDGSPNKDIVMDRKLKFDRVEMLRPENLTGRGLPYFCSALENIYSSMYINPLVCEYTANLLGVGDVDMNISKCYKDDLKNPVRVADVISNPTKQYEKYCEIYSQIKASPDGEKIPWESERFAFEKGLYPADKDARIEYLKKEREEAQVAQDYIRNHCTPVRMGMGDIDMYRKIDDYHVSLSPKYTFYQKAVMKALKELGFINESKNEIKKDQKDLKSLLEKYGKDDILKYVNNINEDETINKEGYREG